MEHGNRRLRHFQQLFYYIGCVGLEANEDIAFQRQQNLPEFGSVHCPKQLSAPRSAQFSVGMQTTQVADRTAQEGIQVVTPTVVEVDGVRKRKAWSSLLSVTANRIYRKTESLKLVCKFAEHFFDATFCAGHTAEVDKGDVYVGRGQTFHGHEWHTEKHRVR